MRQRTRAGFVLPIVLVLLTLATIPLIDMATAGAQSSALVARELLRLRALEAAESGLLAGVDELATRPVPRTRLVRGDDVTVELLRDAVDTLPVGLSLGQAQLEHFRVVARAEGARRSRAELTLGVARLMPREPR